MEGPAAAAGLAKGDIIIAVGGNRVSGMSDFYRKLWALDDSGVKIPLTVLQVNGEVQTLSLRSSNRYDWYRYGTGN